MMTAVRVPETWQCIFTIMPLENGMQQLVVPPPKGRLHLNRQELQPPPPSQPEWPPALTRTESFPDQTAAAVAKLLFFGTASDYAGLLTGTPNLVQNVAD